MSELRDKGQILEHVPKDTCEIFPKANDRHRLLIQDFRMGGIFHVVSVMHEETNVPAGTPPFDQWRAGR